MSITRLNANISSCLIHSSNTSSILYTHNTYNTLTTVTSCAPVHLLITMVRPSNALAMALLAFQGVSALPVTTDVVTTQDGLGLNDQGGLGQTDLNEKRDKGGSNTQPGQGNHTGCQAPGCKREE